MLCEIREWRGDRNALADIEQLEAGLRAHLAGRVYDVQLVFRDHGLVLRGHCRSYYAKQLAQHALMRASPFPLVANEIEVRKAP